ncbi:MAG: hypothetical protein AAFQ94_30380 [Bacteroidota bacterium]
MLTPVSQSEELAKFQLISIAIIGIYRLLRKQSENAEYENQLNKADSEYSQEVHKYEQQYKSYQDALEYQKTLQRIVSTNDGDLQKSLVLKEIYDRLKVVMTESSDTKNGVTESHFYSLLKAKYRHRIIRNKKIGIYTPDFIYHDNLRQIYIDIEIDEPYDLLSGIPIHYQGKDTERDDFFVGINWVVLRFSEYQIFKHEQGCLQCIENVIKLFEYGETTWNSVVKEDERWTFEMAEIMEQNNYRELYLGIEPVNRTLIEEEKIEQDTDNQEYGSSDVDDWLPF